MVGDNFICNSQWCNFKFWAPPARYHPGPPLFSFPSLHATSPPPLTDPVFFPFLFSLRPLPLQVGCLNAAKRSGGAL